MRKCSPLLVKFELRNLSYYKVRREIVHEKAHASKFQKSAFNAQEEANKAVELLKSVKYELGQLNG